MLGVFSVAMLTAGSVDSIRNLPATALFGSSLIFFFILGALFFLLPSALVAAELSSTFEAEGGVYSWVKDAFGWAGGMHAIWFQWIENVIWYPTILSFIAGTLGYLISPGFAHNKFYLVSVILTSFWGMTFINLRGIQSSARFGNICTTFGLLLPMVLIFGLGVVWIINHHPLAISFHRTDLLPHPNSGMWVALTGVILSFCGMEIATVHLRDVKNPQKTFPRAMLVATVIIFVTLMLGSLSIAVVLPNKQISLVAGIMQAFDAFLRAYHLIDVLPLMALMLIIGGLGSVNNWIIAPTRGLRIAFMEGKVCTKLCGLNQYQAPKTLLIVQGLIASVVSLTFLLMPTINSSYWLLTALTSQLYMLMYVLFFIAAIRLRYKNIPRRAGFMIPGKNWGMWIIAGAGLLGSIVTLLIGFIPPSNVINVGHVLRYEGLLLFGLVVMSIPPIIWSVLRHKR